MAVTAASKGNLAVSNELCKETVAVSVRTMFRRISGRGSDRKLSFGLGTGRADMEQIAAGSNWIRREKEWYITK